MKKKDCVFCGYCRHHKKKYVYYFKEKLDFCVSPKALSLSKQNKDLLCMDFNRNYNCIFFSSSLKYRIEISFWKTWIKIVKYIKSKGDK